jgi:YHS domain-containing protein
MATAIDPICQMEVDTENPNGGQSEYQGTSYYFCAPGCKRAFDEDPERCLSAQAEVAPQQQKVSFFSKIFGKKG